MKTYIITSKDKYGDENDNTYKAKNKRYAIKYHLTGCCKNDNIIKIELMPKVDVKAFSEFVRIAKKYY